MTKNLSLKEIQNDVHSQAKHGSLSGAESAVIEKEGGGNDEYERGQSRGLHFELYPLMRLGNEPGSSEKPLSFSYIK
jgi:hypothetical protein